MKTHMKQIITDPNDPIWRVWPSDQIKPWKILCGCPGQEWGTENWAEVSCEDCKKLKGEREG